MNQENTEEQNEDDYVDFTGKEETSLCFEMPEMNIDDVFNWDCL